MSWAELRAALGEDLQRLNSYAGEVIALGFWRRLSLLTRPELLALLLHRLAHYFHRRGGYSRAGWLQRLNLLVTGVDIHPRSEIGPGCLIVHPLGLVIDADIGRRATLFGQSVIGPAYRDGRWSARPRLGEDCTICLQASVLGPVEVGDGVTVGPYTLLSEPGLYQHCVVDCVPGKVRIVSKQ